MSPILKAKDLSIRFQSGSRSTLAADSLSFEIYPDETVALVGESGSGKSATALSLTRLLPVPPACEISGHIYWKDRDILTLGGRELRKIRGKEIAYIFQEPSTSLNPVFSIGHQIEEAIALHRPEIKDRQGEVVRVLNEVGIRDPELRCRDYPHQLSGGMQQRVMIAMALSCQPDLLVADEPTTALDVTIQAQILTLLKSIKQARKMSILLITHNFGIVSEFTDRVLVMFRGKIVESGSCKEVLGRPRHPYTRALLDCIPRLGQKKSRLTTIDYARIEAES